GLAFSGGGIRSATFSLGVLQGLANLRLLPYFDYLSTVSGGGYVGGWLAAWIQRESQPPEPSSAEADEHRAAGARRPAQAVGNVENHPDPTRSGHPEAPREVQPPPIRDEEPEPIHHLRAYSRYLAPRSGSFSTDTWTLLAIYMRNLFINALVLLPAALAAVL